ncbi:MAG: DUF4169 family protein [Amaricoccus sp.]|uniref:DUF4169 family protein n=1 Tax=Amaricoccus sp. TaxID=1872485 RepID=UPI0039E5B18B
MAEVVNLRTARKQRERAEARRRVAVRTGDEAERARAEAALERRRIDGHRRDEGGLSDGRSPDDEG